MIYIEIDVRKKIKKMANKSIRDLRRKKLREKKRKRRKNLIKIGFCALIIVGALKIDLRKKTDDIKIRKPVENRYAQANKQGQSKLRQQ